ncbi:MAG: hypothetical protein HZB91_00655 [Elusimicrobia bacterium]|nr:hypothetical protein [Elusimicrobiota bacterium]
MRYACLAVVLFIGVLAAGEPAEPAKEEGASKRAALVMSLADASRERMDRLERLVRDGGRVEAILGEVKALEADLKKARGTVNWASTQGEEGARSAAQKLAVTSGDIAERLGKLAETAPNAAREAFKKGERRALRTRKECEKRIAEIDVGGRPDPFAEFMAPKLPAATENPSRDAQIDTSGHR